MLLVVAVLGIDIMEDSIRKTGYRKPQHEDIFKETFEEFAPVEGQDLDDLEVEPEQVEDSETFTVDKFREQQIPDSDEDTFDMGRIRERGWKSEEISFEDNDGVEFSQESTSLQEKMEKIETINDKLAQKGINRRYVLGEVDAPKNASVFEDGIGKYFYEVSTNLRPSDVSKVVEEDSWFELSSDGRKLATIKLLKKNYPWLIHEAKSDTEVDNLLERALVSEVDELETEDVFTMEKIEQIKSLLTNR